MSEPTTEKRPSIYSKEVIDLTSADALPRVLEWIRALDENDPALTEPEELEHLKSQINTAVQRGYYDGYATARVLDRDGWDVDGELVDVFEDTCWKAFDHHRVLVEAWVAKNAIKPELAIGDKVIFKAEFKERQGEIVAIRDKTAEYTIFSEEMGHVRKPHGSGVTGVIIPFEETKKSP